MGMPTANDGAVYSYNLDGTDIKAIVPKGKVHTPKQLVVDNEKRQLYFSDREGLRVWRCNFDGQNLELLIQTGDYQVLEEKLDQTRWCVGVAFSHTTGKFYWTQKGPSKGFQGRISQDNIDFPRGQDGTNRTDIECLLQNLPEPIDLEVDGTRQDLYWTDRGGLPLGNNINRVSLKGIKPVSASGITSSPGKDYELVARNLHEAIGIKLDPVNHHIYTTNMGSAVYRFDFDGHNRKKFYEDAGSFTGITLAHV
jgi:sugar lactone lactonase YvrE